MERSSTPSYCRVYLLRHGKAKTLSANGRDEDRELTPEGRAEIRLLGERLVQKNIAFDAIFSSPLVRAVETAALLAETLGLTEGISTLDELASGKAHADLIRKTMKKSPAYGSILFVGHMPDLAEILRELTGENREISFRPGTLIGLSFAEPKALKATIRLRLDA